MKKNKNKTYTNYSNNPGKAATATDPITNSAIGTAIKSYKSFGTIPVKPPYVYKGRKNQTKFPEFVKLCKKTQKELIDILPKSLLEVGYTDIVVGDGYIYAKGTVPVLLTAHMDTVHKVPVRDFYEHVNDKGKHVLASPQGIGGDDRCGIYMILEIIKEHKCSVLFCEDEESGGIGSRKFCKTEFINDLEELKYLIELDRANGTDAVFYDCDNPEFTQFIEENTGYKEAYGSFSDISNLAPECMVAAVNLSCGYYHAHTEQEEVVVEEMLHTIETVKKLLTVECEKFEYIEASYGYGYGKGYGYYGYSHYYGRGYNSWYDDDDKWDSYYDSVTKKTTKTTETSKTSSYDWYEKDKAVIIYVTYYDPTTYEETIVSAYGRSEDSAWVKFFKENPDICWNLVIDYEYDYA